MIDLFYKNIIFKFSKIIILLMLVLTVTFFFSAINLKIDASSDTLILEKDKDLKYFQLLNKRYKSSEFLLIAFKPNEYLLSEGVKKNLATAENAAPAAKAPVEKAAPAPAPPKNAAAKAEKAAEKAAAEKAVIKSKLKKLNDIAERINKKIYIKKKPIIELYVFSFTVLLLKRITRIA